MKKEISKKLRPSAKNFSTKKNLMCPPDESPFSSSFKETQEISSLYDPIIANVLQLLLLDSGLRNALKVHFEIYPQVLTHMSYASEDNGYF